MKITNTCSYAITALTLIAAAPAGSLVANSSICRTANLPERYVTQLLRLLVNEQILLSVRGVTGGYKLARPSSKITLLEIVEAIDGPIGGAEELTIAGMAKASVSTVGRALAGVADDTRKRLAAITVADLRAAKAASNSRSGQLRTSHRGQYGGFLPARKARSPKGKQRIATAICHTGKPP